MSVSIHKMFGFHFVNLYFTSVISKSLRIIMKVNWISATFARTNLNNETIITEHRFIAL